MAHPVGVCMGFRDAHLEPALPPCWRLSESIVYLLETLDYHTYLYRFFSRQTTREIISSHLMGSGSNLHELFQIETETTSTYNATGTVCMSDTSK